MDVSPLIRDRPGTGFEFERFPTLPRFLIGICCYSFSPCRFPSQIFRIPSLLVYVFIGQYHRVLCTSFLRSLIRSKLAERGKIYGSSIFLRFGDEVDFKNSSLRNGVWSLRDSCTIILSSIFKGSFHSFKSWRNLLNPFVFPNLFPQLTFPAPVNFWHSHTINMCENVSSMRSTSLLNLFRCRERYEKRDRGTERINVLIVSRENLV